MMTTDERKKRKRRGADVIHVQFGPGGGRRNEPHGAKDEPHKPPGSVPPPAPVTEPVTDVFSSKEVSRLLGISAAQLRALDKAAVVSPAGERSGKRAYTFQDLIALRATRELLASKIRLADVRKAVSALQRTLPRVVRPLHELRITSDGRSIVVRADERAFEPITGQMVLDFQVDALRRDVVKMLRPGTEEAKARTAYDLYMRASALDEDPDAFDEAEKLYKRAIDLDPSLAIAYTNLGNIRFRRGDGPGAEKLYRAALEIDSRQPEAHYNLGYVMLERGEPARAVPFFLRALQADPRFADAHFNLAMAYEASGEHDRACTHWRKYLEIEPTGTWADVAREHLKK
jgi:tetratricopeptide (TPR) repeat protein